MRRRRAPDRGFFRRYALAFGVAFALVVVAIVGVNLLVEQKLSSVSRVSLQLPAAPSGGANYLMVGSDSRSFVSNASDQQAFGSKSATQGQRSDTIMILHTDTTSGRTLLVSVPRDLWVPIPGQGSAKINSAFTIGPQKLVDTIQADLNVPIHHYVEVNFDTFRKMVDAIGTVPVYFPAPARDHFSDLNVPLPGCIHLNGPQALSFVRSRDLQALDPSTHTWKTVDALPDVGRVGRQQAFVRELASVALNTALSNPLQANGIVDKVIGDLRLDDSFSRGDLFSVIDAFQGVNPRDPTHVQTTTLPFKTGPTQQGQAVLYVKHPEADLVLAALRDFSGGGSSAPSSGSASTPAASSVHVRVLNASGVSGAAARTLAVLQRHGFVGAGTGNDPRGATAGTELRYRSGSAAAARLVAGYAPSARLVTDDSVTGPDVVLVLGRGFAGLSTPTSAAPAASSAGRATPAAAAAPQPGSLAPVPGPC